MNIGEHEYEKKMVQIVEQMEYLMMDVILRCIKKINMENQFVSEVQDIKLEERLENRRHENDF